MGRATTWAILLATTWTSHAFTSPESRLRSFRIGLPSRSNPTCRLGAVSATQAAPPQQPEVAKTPLLQAMWSFTRPHTLIGSALSIPALHIFAAPAGSAVVQSSHLLPLLFAWIPSLLINIYIVGLNQLTGIFLHIFEICTVILFTFDCSLTGNGITIITQTSASTVSTNRNCLWHRVP